MNYEDYRVSYGKVFLTNELLKASVKAVETLNYRRVDESSQWSGRQTENVEIKIAIKV